MVIMFMVLSGMSGFDLCFSGEILPLKLVMTYSNLVNCVHVGRIKTFSSLSNWCLQNLEIAGFLVAFPCEWETVSWHVQES